MIFDDRPRLLVSGRGLSDTKFFKPLFVVVIGLSALASGRLLLADEPRDTSESGSQPFCREVQVILEAVGELKLNADGKKISTLPLKVTGALQYDERQLTANTTGSADRQMDLIRHYQKAQAKIAVGDSESEVTLSPDRSLVVAHVRGSHQELFSPLGPLARDELELIDLQGSTAVLDFLVPTDAVAIGLEWSHDNGVLGLLTGLEVVTQSDARSTCRQIEDQIAIVDLAGTVAGAVDGVASDITLKAKYNIDLRTQQVTWIALSLKETRAIGHAAPGFEVTARIRAAISHRPSSDELADAALAGLPLEATAGSALLRHDSDAGGFALLHGRQWRTMVDRSDVSILRAVENGNLIAQCNISSLPNLPTGQRVQLEAFQADVRRALGDNFGQFVEATQFTNDVGLRVLRAVATGVASELPVQWVYYHVSDDQGRQAALVFTLDAKLVAQFAEADQALVSSFEFQAPSAGTPTPAPAPAATVPTAIERAVP